MGPNVPPAAAVDEAKQQAIEAARAKLRERLGNDTRMGGKGTQRRKKKATHKAGATDEKKFHLLLRNHPVTAVQGVSEVLMEKTDGTMVCFENPKVQAATHCNTFVVTGQSEEKTVERLLEDLMEKRGAEAKKAGDLVDLNENIDFEEVAMVD